MEKKRTTGTVVHRKTGVSEVFPAVGETLTG